MPEEFTYAEAGVDREVRTKSKAALLALKETYKLSKYGKVIQLPYGNIFPVGDRYLDFVIEGIGTKVLLAQLADKYDTIGIDGVAMAVNDVIRSGATPLAVVDNIHAQVSNPRLVKEWMKGIVKAVTEAGCLVPGGEIGDVADVIKGITEDKGFDMVFACVGELLEKDIIFGNNIKPGDVVIGLRSSGIHSNGISLARKVLFKEWGGKYEPYDVPDGFSREIVYEVLEPTRIYVKPVLNATKEVEIKGAVHITGDAYQKFDKLMKFSKGIGFEFNNFKPQPIFELIQKTAPEVRGVIKDEEMLKTFNMGWGFAVVVDECDEESVNDSLQKTGVKAERIGKVTSSGKIVVLYKGKKLELR
ncbi:MAG: phosphoribosylformylglycinamidine cyclo-ligase [Candidatus Bathyarchaeota archaeon]|nr:phosphoribosylformylglycinamidine cyclo-ligase [Candidatus Bathyarchaeota archaeon]MDH5622856.1 phosphoribosylformylglycinamidine cyclo-ligase [Candidatus Bathyarchaeota archaeon]MDH5635233.1 phosphoribosylformylglycinamidine cyclo-ligase [Candidatus Bathyarchaeota archaeon]MDH5701362.1 phosphoribosylformylglycinamidine cyclo-ligase [Candidatus Bathyarchaeota archaeon]